MRRSPRRLRRDPREERRQRAAKLGGFAEAAFAEPPASFERPIVERIIARPFREAAFSGSIKAAYQDTCAFTGLKIINGGGRSEVQAAHIRPVAASGPDSLRNGLALCGTVHWMFDRGLISIADNHELLLARGKVPEPVRRMLNSGPPPSAPSRPDQRRIRCSCDGIARMFLRGRGCQYVHRLVQIAAQ